MKKVLTLVLVVLMVFGMTSHAFALEESYAEWERLLPTLSTDSAGLVLFYAMDDDVNLSEDDLRLMYEAHGKLDEARPEHLALTHFCMVEIVGSGDVSSIVFAPIDHHEIQFKQYVDGEWILLEHTVNEDRTITVEGIMDGPLVIFTNFTHGNEDDTGVSTEKIDSREAQAENLIPKITSESSHLVLLHSTEMVPHMSEEIQDLMAEAKAKLKDACPPGLAAKFFCYVEILGGAESATVIFEHMEFEEIHFEQYIDGEWVECDYVVNEDGTITVKGVVEGPKIIFIK